MHLDPDADFSAFDTFSTARLRAERLTEDHRDYLVELHRDPEVMEFLGGVRTVEGTAEWLDANLAHWAGNGFGQWMLRDASGALVGRGGLRWNNPIFGERLVEVGYAFQRSAWGVGYATELTNAVVGIARDSYAMPQLGAITVVGHDASGRVLTKCGFVYEGDVEHPSGPCHFYRLQF